MRISIQNKIAFAILLTAFVPLTYWGRLEEVMYPIHLSFFTGEPDAWGTRINLLVLLGIAVVLYIVLLLCCRFPKMINYPVWATEEDKVKMFPMGVELAQRLNYLLMLVFSLITNCSSLMAIGLIDKFPVYMLWVSFLCLIAAVVKFTIQVRRVGR